MRLSFTTYIALVSLTGCATTYDPNDYYDPQAIEKAGRIVSKQVARTEPRKWGDSHPPIVVPVGGVFLAIPTGPSRGESRIDIYEYLVKVSDTETIAVYSEFPSHDIGQCVKVFLSQRPSYPRIAFGAECKN